MFGSGGQIRTDDLMVMSHTRYSFSTPLKGCWLLATSVLIRPIDSTASAFTNMVGDCLFWASQMSRPNPRSSWLQGLESNQRLRHIKPMRYLASPPSNVLLVSVRLHQGFDSRYSLPFLIASVTFVRYSGSLSFHQQECGLLWARPMQSTGMNSLKSAGLQDTKLSEAT